MASSKQLNLPPSLVQSVSSARESNAPQAVQEVSLVGMLADAVASTGCSEKEAAIAQGYGPAYWSRIKAGEKAAHLDRVSRLPESVQRAFVGVPDLAVCHLATQRLWLFEVKDGAKAPSARKLKPEQVKFHQRWREAPVKVVMSVDEALEAIR